METKKPPLSIRIIYWVTNVLFWLSIVISFVMLFDNILLYTGIETNVGTSLHLPISINIQETGHLNQHTTLKLITYSHLSKIVDPPVFIAKKIAIVILFFVLIGIYILWIFRKFIKNVKQGEIFSIHNISLLKKISYVYVGLWLVRTVFAQFIYSYFIDHIQLDNVKILSGGFFYNLNLDLLWNALIIWVLAHIFITGLKLQREKDLTI